MPRSLLRIVRGMSFVEKLQIRHLKELSLPASALRSLARNRGHCAVGVDARAALGERRVQLVETTRNQVEEPPMLHPGLAEVYWRKVEKLTQALNKDELRSEAAEMLRSMIQATRFLPEDGALAIELVGELAGILALTNEKTPRLYGPGARQLTLVAGAGFEPAAFRL